jgi:hypothetical protein
MNTSLGSFSEAISVVTAVTPVETPIEVATTKVAMRAACSVPEMAMGNVGC